MKMERYIDKRTNPNKQNDHDKIHGNKSALSSTFSFKGILDPISCHRSLSMPLTSAPHPHFQSPCTSTGSHFYSFVTHTLHTC